MVYLVGALALTATAIGGGWEWTVVAAVLLAALYRTGCRPAFVLAAVLPGLCWIILYRWTGDRRFFFPYSMQYAAQMAGIIAGPPARRAIAGGGSVVLAFVLVRLAQSATARVLIVEILVATAVLALSPAVYRRERMALACGAAVTSILAYAGLAF